MKVTKNISRKKVNKPCPIIEPPQSYPPAFPSILTNACHGHECGIAVSPKNIYYTIRYKIPPTQNPFGHLYRLDKCFSSIDVLVAVYNRIYEENKKYIRNKKYTENANLKFMMDLCC